jgi:hypothetical protein
MLLSWRKLFDGNNFHEGASMSTTLLYHMYNIRGYRQRGMQFVPGELAQLASRRSGEEEVMK